VNEEVTRYNTILKKLADAQEDEWEAIVTVYRGDLQKGFFDHMQVRHSIVLLCLGLTTRM
jgi:hypothetical protein